MIRYYAGVEGSGKSAMMTRDLLFHYIAGGRILAFPGYELYGNTKKQLLSEPMLPEQILELIDSEDSKQIKKIRQQKIAIAIDEVPNFFDHHTWYNKINDVMKSVFQQRRKTNVIILMTGPIFEELPPDLRRMVHEVVHCRDLHTTNRSIKRGLTCVYYKEDKRGLLSHPLYRFTIKHKFPMSIAYKHYDTFAAVSPMNQFIKMKFKGREVVIGADGKVIQNQEGDLNDYDTTYLDTKVSIAAKVEELRGQGKEELQPYEFAEILDNMGFTSTNRNVKAMFAARGLSYERESHKYKIRELASV